MDQETDDQNPLDDAEILEDAKERYKRACEYWQTNFEDMDEDIEFLHGEKQWDDEIRQQRKNEGRPCLTFNKLPGIVDQAVGDQRRSSPTIKCVPNYNNVETQNPQIMNQAGTKDYSLAEVYEGVLRNIQQQSNASIAYDTAYEHAASWGLGWFRIMADYLDDTSFDQEFIIKRVRNYKSVIADPDFEEPDGSDMEYCFIVSTIPEDEFKRKYPEAKETDFSNVERGQLGDWVQGDDIIVAEYYFYVPDNFTLYQLANGEVVREKPNATANVVKTRNVKGKKVTWAKITGQEVLEKKDIVFDSIPVIPVLGKELIYDGKARYRGLIRHSKDAQRMYNYSRSADIERTALIPKTPYIAAAEQIEDYESEWKNANRANPAVLRYKNVPGLPPPMRQPPPSTNSGETAQSMQASDDIKATSGIYDASLGARSNETSGRAIVARQSQGDTVLVPYADNLSRSMTFAGKLIVEATPKLYDTKRLLRLRFPDGQDDFVEINTLDADGNLIHDLGVVKFDVTIETGPAFSTQRAEALDAMVQIIQANPSLWSIIGDLIAKNMDWPGAHEFEKRLRSQLPEQFLTDKEKAERPPPQPDPEMQAKMAKAQADMAKSQADMAQAQADIELAKSNSMQAQADAMKAIESINQLESNIRNQVADAIAEHILQTAQNMGGAVPRETPAPQQIPPQPGAT